MNELMSRKILRPRGVSFFLFYDYYEDSRNITAACYFSFAKIERYMRAFLEAAHSCAQVGTIYGSAPLKKWDKD